LNYILCNVRVNMPAKNRPVKSVEIFSFIYLENAHGY
jgi:hypothetical protein